MAQIQWTAELSVGHVLLDEQHRHLIALINALSGGSGGGGSDTADVVLEHLARFIQFHFETEEMMLRQVAYPDLQAHAQEHRFIMDRLSRHVTEMEASGRTNMHEMSELLWTWVNDHLSTSEQRYAPFLRKVIAESA